MDVFRRLRENVRRKRPELWRSGDWFLHHDNAPAHTALSRVIRYLDSLGWTVVPHPPYSPELAPRDFLFPTMKKNIERKEICHRGGGENSFAGGPQHQASAVPEKLHTVEKKIGQMYCLQ